MSNPVTLPSGKIIDLKRFIALLPSEKGYDLVLEGFSSPINLEKSDGENITDLLKIHSISSTSEINDDLKLRITYLDREQQQQKKQSGMKSLKEWIERDKNREPTPEEQEYEQEFKRIMDAERTPEQKLYSDS